jgi:hypothetical protein
VERSVLPWVPIGYERKEKGLCPPDASAEGGAGLEGRYVKLPPNNWSSASEEERLWWNMASCDDCDKLRRFPQHFSQFFPCYKVYEFSCGWNVWDNFNTSRRQSRMAVKKTTLTR